MASTIRHNFHEECEAAVNKQINQELYNSYVYMSMVSLYHVFFSFLVYALLLLLFVL